MSEERFDAIVVGAGPAGGAAAYCLAREGASVVLIERGEDAGSKNLSGGVLYGRALEQLIPGFWQEAPVERHISNYVTTLMAGDGWLSLDFKTGGFSLPPYNGHTVLRAKFDRWLAQKAEEAGAFLMNGIRVDSLLREGDRVAGVVAGGETLRSEVVVAADGANSFLAQQAGLRGPIPTRHLAVGVKSLIGLPRETIEERFHLSGDEGVAYGLVGDVTHGVAGGGFLYTNRESLSIGVVMRLDDLVKSRRQSSEVAQDFLEHPLVAPLVKGGRLLEYGAHLVPEGGLEMMPRLATDGMVVVGDAAGFTLNNGLVVRGMDLALGSGIAAARAILEAKAAGDFSGRKLEAYRRNLEDGFVLKDLRTYAGAPRFLEREGMYREYPELLTGLMAKLFTHDATPKEQVARTAWKAFKESGLSLRRVVGDLWAGVRSL